MKRGNNSNSNQLQICLISPEKGLDTFSSLTRRQFALAHIARKSPGYCDYFKRMRERGDYIILDNGAWELGVSISNEELSDLAEQCYANCIILPDSPHHSWKTTASMTLQYLLTFAKPGYDYMYVPSAGDRDLEDYIEAYKWASTIDQITHIGISRMTGNKIWPEESKAWSRVRLVLEIKRLGCWNNTKRHHALGWLGSLDEFPYLDYLGFESLDFGGAVWRGYCGYSIFDKDWPDTDVDFFAELVPANRSIVDRNVREALSVLD